MARVLVVEESEKDAGRLSKIFRSVKVPVEVSPNMEVALERIAQDPPALVIVSKPERAEVLHGLEVTLRAHAPATPFLVTLPASKMDQAMEAMHRGAFDCVAKPYSSAEILVAAKRATLKAGRMLFVKKIEPRETHGWKIVGALAVVALAVLGFARLREGGPPPAFSLGSVNLTGIQWDGRALWVGDWFESTVTRYELEKAVRPSLRTLEARTIYRMQDGQPILVLNTPEVFVTAGTDLKLRVHQKSVGLPTFQTVAAPGVSPAGLAWDGRNLWSCDSRTNLIYKHSQDMRVIDSVKSILPHPSGLAWDGTSLWVIGDKPLKAAKLDFAHGGVVWRGPVSVARLLPEAVTPTGFSIGFGRLWAVSGGDPRVTSIPIPTMTNAAPVRKENSPAQETGRRS